MINIKCPYCESHQETPDNKKKTSGLFGCMIVVFINFFLFFGVLYPNMTRSRTSGRICRCQSNLKNIALALDEYAHDHQGHYPQELKELVSEKYLGEIPLCQVDIEFQKEKDTYSESYVSSTNPDAFTLFCEGENHTLVTDIDYPQYNSYQGLVTRP